MGYRTGTCFDKGCADAAPAAKAKGSLAAAKAYFAKSCRSVRCGAIRFFKKYLKTASAAKNVGGREPFFQKGVRKGRAKSVCATPTGQNHMSILRDAINRRKLRRAGVLKKDMANEAEAKRFSKADPFEALAQDGPNALGMKVYKVFFFRHHTFRVSSKK